VLEVLGPVVQQQLLTPKVKAAAAAVGTIIGDSLFLYLGIVNVPIGQGEHGLGQSEHGLGQTTGCRWFSITNPW
jgi:hypothetical protein